MYGLLLGSAFNKLCVALHNVLATALQHTPSLCPHMQPRGLPLITPRTHFLGGPYIRLAIHNATHYTEMSDVRMFSPQHAACSIASSRRHNVHRASNIQPFRPILLGYPLVKQHGLGGLRGCTPNLLWRARN